MKNYLRLFMLPMAVVFMMTGCQKFSDSLSLENMLIGKNWINNMVNGEVVETDNTFILHFNNGVQMYSSVNNYQNGRTWAIQQGAKYSIIDNTIKIEAVSLQKELLLQVISITPWTLQYKVLHRVEGGVEIEDDNVYSFYSLDVDYSNQLVGLWEGRNTTPGTVYTEEARWDFHEAQPFPVSNEEGPVCLYASLYDYYKATENGTWKFDNHNGYGLYNDLLVCTFEYNGVPQCDVWKISFSGSQMNWKALRNGKIHTVQMNRVQE